MRRSLRGYVRARLQRRLFLWFGFSIAAAVLTTATFLGVMNHSLGPGPWQRQPAGALQFLALRYAAVWDDPAGIQSITDDVETYLHMGVTVRDGAGTVLVQRGSCSVRPLGQDIVRRGQVVGRFDLCGFEGTAWQRWRVPLALVFAAAILWGIMGRLARQLARPLMDVARVAQDIGAGKLSSRARLGVHQLGEVGMLAYAINDMAAKIEKQMADQRTLLALVSHELRTPLARLRVLVELGREAAAPALPKVFSDIEREVVEVDELVGKLLAQSRLDFAALARQPLKPRTVATEALGRADLPPQLLDVQGDVPETFLGDATLIQRALANLLENARKHGGGAQRLVLRRENQELHFVVNDAGPGMEGTQARLFDAFYQGAGAQGRDPTSLGLGLHLVRRIAMAHGGRAYAQNLAEGGAGVGFTVALERANDGE